MYVSYAKGKGTDWNHDQDIWGIRRSLSLEDTNTIFLVCANCFLWRIAYVDASVEYSEHGSTE